VLMQSQFPQTGNATVVGDAMSPLQQYFVPKPVVGGIIAPQPYNVSPMLQRVELASLVDGSVISPVSPMPIHRRPVGEAEFQK
jgi:hypothetical protein